MAIDMTTAQAVLKEYYSGNAVKDLAYKSNPFLALVQKRTNFVGRVAPWPLRFGNPQNRSATFTYAARVVGPSATDSSKYEDFQIRRVKNYGTAVIDGELMKVGTTDLGSFLDTATAEVNGNIMAVTNDLALDLFGRGTGRRGVIATITPGATTVITFVDARDALNFEVGMNLWAAATETGAVRSAVAEVPTVVAVDRSGNSITVNADTSLYGSPWAPADSVFAAGDAPNGGAFLKVVGLDGWLPATVTSAPFFGVDRTVDVDRLGGIRYDGTGDTISEALMEAGARLVDESEGSPDVVLMNPRQVAALQKELGSAVVRNRVWSPDAEAIGFDTIELHTGAGAVQVIADRNCPRGVAYMLQLDTWTLLSADDAPHILEEDGNMMLRLAGADAYQVRAGYYAQLACDAPGYNCRIALPSA